MQDEKLVSPYLMRRPRSLEEVLRQRLIRLARSRGLQKAPEADNGNKPPEALPPARSA